MTDLPFQNQTYLVTGATSGIGRATVKLLAKRGARIFAVARNQEALQTLLLELPGKDHKPFALDLSDPDAAETLWDQVNSPLNGMVHSAGTLHPSLAELGKKKNRGEAMQLHTFFPQDFLQTGLQRKQWAPRTAIVWLSSLSVKQTAVGYLHYSMAKSALEAACRQWALELSQKEIRVNVVRPGLIRTPMSDKALGTFTEAERRVFYEKAPLGFGTPEDVAYSIAFLLSGESRWITGSAIDCNGGSSL